MYAQFIAQSTLHNGGVAIGLLRGAGTRMASWFYAMHRLLRLKTALTATIHQLVFRELLKGFKNNETIEGAIKDIEDATFWSRLYFILRANYAALVTLRWCDSNRPMMDRLYFATKQTADAIEKSKEYLSDKELFPVENMEFEMGINYQRELEQVFGEEGDDDEAEE